jgi:hypothetical protein
MTDKTKWIEKLLFLKHDEIVDDSKIDEIKKYKKDGLKKGYKITPRKEWILDLIIMAYNGDFENAKKLMKSGTKKGWKMTKKEATEIIKNCGVDMRYSFVKPLMDIGGKIIYNKSNYEFAEFITDKKNMKKHKKMYEKNFDDIFKGSKLVLEYSQK